MPVKLSIIGLGQIGTSAGLALRNFGELVERCGYDVDLTTLRHARQIGALDCSVEDLTNVVQEADLILLCLPMNEVHGTLSQIAPHLKAEAVVLDTAPVKSVVAGWAAELLPAGCAYVGLVPVINPAYLQTHDSGQEAAQADLFRDTPMLIAAPSNTPSAAIKQAADLTRLLGATPLFAELFEVDALMASTHVLPQILSAALVNAVLETPGWSQGRQLAGRPFAELSGLITQTSQPDAISEAAVYGSDDLLRALDSLMAALGHMRSDIAAADRTSLASRLQRARRARQLWWQRRQAANWSNDTQQTPELSAGSQVFERLLGVGRSRMRGQ